MAERQEHGSGRGTPELSDDEPDSGGYSPGAAWFFVLVCFANGVLGYILGSLH